MIIRFLIIPVIALLVDAYFYQGIRSLTAKWHIKPKKRLAIAYWSVSALAIIHLIIAAILNKGYSNMVHVMYAFDIVMILTIGKIIGSIPLLINDLYRGIRLIEGLFHTKKQIGDESPKLNRLQFFNKAAVGLAAIPMVAMVYGMLKTAFDFSVKKVVLTFPNLPDGFDGFKFVQISDIHTGSFLSDSHFRNAINLIGEQKPEAIFFTGDLVNNVSDEATRFMPVLSSLKAPMGVFSTLGNHDYGDYVQDWESKAAKDANLARIIEIHSQMGWNLLMNKNVTLMRNGSQIALIGVENWGAKHGFSQYGDLEKAVIGTEDKAFKILLSHDPSHWDAKVRPLHPDIDLTLSGHTHGFQVGIEIPGFKWSPSQYLYEQWAGLYQKGKQYIYVNRGFGFLGYLGRVGIPPEITVFELKKG
jgi:predicted MPP superfamily phosphohydrolase